jgi:hypothetical protein
LRVVPRLCRWGKSREETIERGERQQVGSKSLATRCRAPGKRKPIAIDSHVPFDVIRGATGRAERARGSNESAVGRLSERAKNLGKRTWLGSTVSDDDEQDELGARRTVQMHSVQRLSHLDWYGNSRSRREGGGEADNGTLSSLRWDARLNFHVVWPARTSAPF